MSIPFITKMVLLQVMGSAVRLKAVMLSTTVTLMPAVCRTHTTQTAMSVSACQDFKEMEKSAYSKVTILVSACVFTPPGVL